MKKDVQPFLGPVVRLYSVLCSIDIRHGDSPLMTTAMGAKEDLQRILGPAHQNLAAFPLYFYSTTIHFPTVEDRTIV